MVLHIGKMKEKALAAAGRTVSGQVRKAVDSPPWSLTTFAHRSVINSACEQIRAER